METCRFAGSKVVMHETKNQYVGIRDSSKIWKSYRKNFAFPAFR